MWKFPFAVHRSSKSSRLCIFYLLATFIHIGKYVVAHQQFIYTLKSVNRSPRTKNYAWHTVGNTNTLLGELGTPKNKNIKNTNSQNCNSTTECLPNMIKALDSILAPQIIIISKMKQIRHMMLKSQWSLNTSPTVSVTLAHPRLPEPVPLLHSELPARPSLPTI